MVAGQETDNKKCILKKWKKPRDIITIHHSCKFKDNLLSDLWEILWSNRKGKQTRTQISCPGELHEMAPLAPKHSMKHNFKLWSTCPENFIKIVTGSDDFKIATSRIMITVNHLLKYCQTRPHSFQEIVYTKSLEIIIRRNSTATTRSAVEMT